MLVAGCGLTDRAAARAGLGAVLGSAGAAKPLPADGPVQVDDPLAAGAGGVDDRLRSSIAELVDQPKYRGDRGFGSGSSEQLGLVLQHPGQALTVPGAGHGRRHCHGDLVGRQRRVDARDDSGDQVHGVAPVVGRALGASGTALAITAADSPELAACRAGLSHRTAYSAVPVLTAALEGAQLLAALGADRRRDPGRAGLAQRDEKVRDRAGRRGLAIGQHRRPVQQGLRQPAPFSAAAGHALDHIGDRRAVQGGS